MTAIPKIEGDLLELFEMLVGKEVSHKVATFREKCEGLDDVQVSALMCAFVDSIEDERTVDWLRLAWLEIDRLEAELCQLKASGQQV